MYKSNNPNQKSKELTDLLIGYNPTIYPSGKTVKKDDITNSRIIYPDGDKV